MSDDITGVILTHGNAGTPHMEALCQSNPHLRVSVYESPEGRGAFPNCDRNIRDWVKVNRTSGHVLFLEYDVLVNGPLSDVLVGDCDVEGAWCLENLMRDKHYAFLHAVLKLPERVRQHACVLAPLAVVLLSPRAQEVLRDTELDDIFEISMDSEVRFPSVLAWKGLSLFGNPAMSHVRCQTRQLPKKSRSIITHPVKSDA